MLNVENISLSIGSKKILNDISFTAKSGELLAIIGANGAGKSSLLKVLVGDAKPDSGKVTLNNKLVSLYKSKELAKLRGVLAQSFSLNLPYKVEEVIMMGRYPHFNEVPAAQDFAIVHKAMVQVDVIHLKDRTYTTLSGGEKQRVHIARVLSQIWEDEKTDSTEPKYLFLDEPVSSLDILHQHKILQLGVAMKNKGYSVVAVLHDMNLASQYADRVMMLKNGMCIACGSRAQVLTEQNIYNGFGIAVSILNQPGYPYSFIVPDSPVEELLQKEINTILQ